MRVNRNYTLREHRYLATPNTIHPSQTTAASRRRRGVRGNSSHSKDCS